MTDRQITRTPVTSSTIASIGHDPLAQVLHVQFHSGQTYAYYDVSEADYAAFLAAPSKGSYLHRHIKGLYRTEKLREEKD